MHTERLKERIQHEITAWIERTGHPAFHLAKQMQLTPDYISRMRNGVNVSDIPIIKAAEYFGVEVVEREVQKVITILDVSEERVDAI